MGIAITPEDNAATPVGPLVITQDFGNRFYYGAPAVFGVVYSDFNANGRFEAGEDFPGVALSITGSVGVKTRA